MRSRVSVRNGASPKNPAINSHSDAGQFGKRRPLALLGGPRSGDGFRSGFVLCRFSSVGRRGRVNSLLHCVLLACMPEMHVIGHQEPACIALFSSHFHS